MTSRHDISQRIYKTFEVKNDTEAKKIFEKMVKKKCNAWNDMDLIRVDVEEKTTHVCMAYGEASNVIPLH